MKNQTKLLIFTAVILAAVYAYKFTDWFAEKKIQIKFRSLGRVQGNGKTSDPITFFLDKEYRLTSIKIISLDDAATNKYPHDFWHLISESNSIPVSDFVYGKNISGMKPSIAGLAAEPLQKAANYRITVEAGKLKGEKDFQPREGLK